MIFFCVVSFVAWHWPQQWCGHTLSCRPWWHQVLWRELSQDFLLGVTNLQNQTMALGFDLPVSFNKKGAKLGVISQSSDESVDSGLHLYFLVIYASHICKPYIRYTLYTLVCVYIPKYACVCVNICACWSFFSFSLPLLFAHLACCSEAQDREGNCFSWGRPALQWRVYKLLFSSLKCRGWEIMIRVVRFLKGSQW